MIIIPDVHGRDFWKSAVAGREDEEIIFLGDYVDPYAFVEDVHPMAGLMCLLEIIEFKKQHPANVTLLLGNHDLSYVTDYIFKCRHDYDNAETIRNIILENLPLFRIAHEKTIGGRHYIFTHAGILPAWLAENDRILGMLTPDNVVAELNQGLATGEIYAALGDVSEYRGGHLEVGSCVWADIDEHFDHAAQDALAPNSNSPATGWADVYQIFGHTQQFTGEPIITPRFACLDCRRAFCLNDDGEITRI